MSDEKELESVLDYIIDKKEVKNSDDGQIAVARALDKLIDYVGEATEFRNDLVPMALYKKNKYLEPYITYIERGKKHKKRKFQAEIIKIISNLAKTIQFNSFANERDIDNPDMRKRFRSRR